MKNKKLFGSLLIGFLVFIAGATGLIYQVVWVRLLTRIFGNSVFGVSAVLSAFMGGLAVGSYICGRLSDRHNPLKIFAYLNFAVAVCGIFLPYLLGFMNNIYTLLYNNFHTSFYVFSIFRFLFSFLLLIVPSALLGGTFPVVVKYYISTRHANLQPTKDKSIPTFQHILGRDIGILYGISTLGAVVGCFVSGFFMIKLLGMNLTVLTSSIINTMLGVIGLIMSKSSKRELITEQENAKASVNVGYPDTKASPHPAHPNLILIALFVSGFAALSYEILWIRILSIYLDNAVYTFTIMLTTFLGGLGLGSIIFAWLFHRFKKGLALYGVLSILIGITSIASLEIGKHLSVVDIWFQNTFKTSAWWHYRAEEFLISSIIMLIPTILIGMIIPLASKIYIQHLNKLGGTFGKIYSIDTVGAIFGSFITGFAFIPLIGIQKCLILISAMNLTIGTVLFFSDSQVKGKTKNLVLIFVLFVFTGSLFVPSTPLVQSEIPRADKLLYYKECPSVTTTIYQEPATDFRIISVNGKQVADTNDVQLYILLGDIPMLLHPDPKNALVIGFGAGVTSGAIARHNVNLDIVEISPGVPEGSKVHFAKENRDVSNYPGLNLIIEDGRNHILSTNKKYDVISADPIHPNVYGSAQLYTKEFYQYCKDKLNDDGVICIWLPLHVNSTYDYQLIIKTFISVFPDAYMWYAPVNCHTILTGHKKPLSIDFRLLKKRMNVPEVKNQLAGVYLDNPYTFLSNFMMGEKKLSGLVEDIKQINTDNLAHIEFSVSEGAGAQHLTLISNLVDVFIRKEEIKPYVFNISPKEKAELNLHFMSSRRVILGQTFQLHEKIDRAKKEYKIASTNNPDDRIAEYFAFGQFKRFIDTQLKRIEYDAYDWESYRNLGYYYLQENNPDEAIKYFEKVIEILPDRKIGYLDAAYCYEAKGISDKAKEYYNRAQYFSR
ncbi:MAG: fused MFS/spermidine synthase [Elusimicrobiota bacterium]